MASTRGPIIFPDVAMRRLSGALAGYYVLFVEKPESRTPHAQHRGGAHAPQGTGAGDQQLLVAERGRY